MKMKIERQFFVQMYLFHGHLNLKYDFKKMFLIQFSSELKILIQLGMF